MTAGRQKRPALFCALSKVEAAILGLLESGAIAAKTAR